MKYLRSIVCVFFSFFRMLVLKCKGVNCGLFNICSPIAEIKIEKNTITEIGKKLKLRSNSHIRVRKKAMLRIGKNASFNYGCMLVVREKVVIGDNLQLAPNVMIYDHDHDYSVGIEKLEYLTSPIVIGDNVWIGANSVILRGTEIGDNCVIAAGSVVKGKIPANTVVLQKRETTYKQYNVNR